jgi:hypothetical protein
LPHWLSLLWLQKQLGAGGSFPDSGLRVSQQIPYTPYNIRTAHSSSEIDEGAEH